jgi:hypothetical protein
MNKKIRIQEIILGTKRQILETFPKVSQTISKLPSLLLVVACIQSKKINK